MAERVLPYPEALAEVLAAAASLSSTNAGQTRSERLPLLATLGRTLAEPVRAERDQPPFPRSTRDGFAVRSADLPARTPLHVLGLLRAGEQWTGPALGTGETIEIMTGAPAPEGADAVLMVEHTESSSEAHIRPLLGRTLVPGENIVPRGAEALARTELIPAGRPVGAPEIALAASCGYAELVVHPRPRVAILATGDELVELTDAPETWQIRNSNSYALAALVTSAGGEPQRLPIARDTRDDLHDRLAGARDADLLLLSGGVSMGKYDLVEDALREAGAEFLFTGTLIQPGKPLVFGRLPRPSGTPGKSAGWTYFFGLPGNPISTEVCFRLFVTPLLRALAGGTDLPPRFAEARLAEDVRGGVKVTRFLPAEISGDWGGVNVRLIPWHGSGDLAANGRANGFVVLPAGVAQFTAGETVRVLLR